MEEPKLVQDKRKLHTMDRQTFTSFKIRALLRQLRPHFLEVLRTPNFRECKSAHEIRLQMKLVLDLYKEMAVETNLPGKEERESKRQKLDQPRTRNADEKTNTASRLLNTYNVADETTNTASRIRGSYIVGGSVYGLNFITYSGPKPVYYGVTKESYRKASRNKETICLE